MAHWLATPEDERPELVTRERVPGKIEAQCPACGQWRPGFTIAPVEPPRDGQAWACDGCRTRWARIEAQLAQPPEE